MQENNEKGYEALLRIVNDKERFSGKNSIQIREIREGFCTGEMENTPATQNTHGGIHGGALTTLADTVAGVAVTSLGYSCVTLSNTMEFLRVAAPGPVCCEGRVRKAGRSITVCETVITDSQGREIALGVFSYFMKQKIAL